ncbi:hypothetical protein [Nostoc sp. UHCC 0870]|uniref:hypothetical protein n=1 Tax=Nostoc sp. UHCC 0870 TaxID=2914041 RepID=UPI001EDE621D|nr:hypothetical protein [Nostoc sp. UHCC 0870]UKO99671.1 hypothetical protein L6494_08180 [Nostoc sp. UHCC 0870]
MSSVLSKNTSLSTSIPGSDNLVMLPRVVEPHPQPLPVYGEGRRGVAIAGEFQSGFISH